MKKNISYTLYDTLSVKIQREQLSSQEQKELKKYISMCEDSEKKKAILLLIIEHAIRTSSFKVRPRKLSLPYDIENDETDNLIEFDLESIPIQLQWILLKFLRNVYKDK